MRDRVSYVCGSIAWLAACFASALVMFRWPMLFWAFAWCAYKTFEFALGDQGED